MTRVGILAWFMVRDLFRSWTGIVPLAGALAFGTIAFEYGMDQAQFVTVGGVGIGALCLLTTLLLANRADRAVYYPLVARLRHRHELLSATVVCSLSITTGLAVVIAGANLLLGRLQLAFPSLLWIGPTWFALWLLMASLALNLSGLVGRDGSHLVGYVAVVALLVGNDRKSWLASRGLDWLVQGLTALFWPVSSLLSKATSGIHDRTYFSALAITLLIGMLLYLLAAQMFEDKDLLWSE